MKPLFKTIALLLAGAALTTGCERYEGFVHEPAFLHLDSMAVVNDPIHSISNQDGFFTSEIDAVQIEVWFDGDARTTQLGSYALPCTVPILDNRPIKKVQVYPFVKQNGIVSTHIYYPYYTYGMSENLPLKTDSITNLGTKDPATGRWYYNVHYRNDIQVLKQEYFESQQYSIVFDSVVTWLKNTDRACTGNGCGLVHVNSTTEDTTFTIEGTMTLNQADAYLYLEMDYKTDVRLNVGMISSRTIGTNKEMKGVETLYPTENWQKIYINLGKTWKYFNYNPEFQLVFTAMNGEQIEGDVLLDNVKIVAY